MNLPKKVRSMLTALLEDHQNIEPHHEDMCRLCLDATAMLSRKPKRAVKAAATRRTQKRLSKKEETAAIRAAVMKRADGRCELCGHIPAAFEPLEMHHALGRVRAKQAEGNCLGICRTCHWDITNARPGWLQKQADVFRRLGHLGTAWRLESRAEFVEAKAALSAAVAP